MFTTTKIILRSRGSAYFQIDSLCVLNIGEQNRARNYVKLCRYSLFMENTKCEELEISINEFLSEERISDEDFRKKADANIISSLNREKLIRREKRVSDFFGGAGTGILVSILYSPDSIRRTVAIFIAIIMICIGWYYKAKLDKYIIDKSEN